MEIIDNSTNELKYKSDKDIIYLADLYFTETIIKKTKQGKTRKINKHKLKDELWSVENCETAKEYYNNKWKRKLGIIKPGNKKSKEEKTFVLDKVVITKKIAYKN